MRGAIVFVIAFLVFLLVTLVVYSELPPGNLISDALGIDPAVDWSGVNVRTLVAAIMNGIIYGVIIWLIFWLIEKARQ